MQHRQAVLLRWMISARHYGSCGGVLRSSVFSPSLNLLLAMGTVQKLLSALACILLKMDKDQLPSTTEGVSSRSLRPPADLGWITANCISGTAWSAKEGCHLGPPPSCLLISQHVWGQWWKKVRWLCGHCCQTARTQFKEQEQTAVCFL